MKIIPDFLKAVFHIAKTHRVRLSRLPRLPRLYKPKSAPAFLWILETKHLLALLLAAGKPTIDFCILGQLLALIFILMSPDNSVERTGLSILPRQIPPFHTPEVRKRSPGEVMISTLFVFVVFE